MHFQIDCNFGPLVVSRMRPVCASLRLFVSVSFLFNFAPLFVLVFFFISRFSLNFACKCLFNCIAPFAGGNVTEESAK